MAEAERRRRRHRHHGPDETAADERSRASTVSVPDVGGGDPPRGRRGGDDGERGLRGLVGSGSSQVSVTAAMRARDAAQPTEDDLAEAAARLVIVRRNWTPREDLPRR